MKKIFVLLVITGLCGCADMEIRDFEYHPNDDIKQGPGLFSGEDGEFILYEK